MAAITTPWAMRPWPARKVEHDARLHRLDDLLGEIEVVMLAVYDQGRSRERAA